MRAILHVSGDGLRVVEEDTKGLIVDQTIEKVSFCAPDRNHERGFRFALYIFLTGIDFLSESNEYFTIKFELLLYR